MPTIHLVGKILPQTHYSTTMWGLPTIHYESRENDLVGDLNVQVRGSAIDIECAMNRIDPDVFPHVHKIAYDMARTAINVVSFATGITLTVVFDEIIDADGAKHPFAIQHPDLAELCTSYQLEPSETAFGVGDILKIILSEPALFAALDDLITATSHHGLITVNSARAIEGLRHAMALPGMHRGVAWNFFRTNLNLTKEYLCLITDNSQSGRHGEGKYIAGPITTEIIKRSWIIMNRFLEFRKRGSQALPEAEFPVLSGMPLPPEC